MRGAVIDLGTNTFNLLIFEREFGKNKTVFSQRTPVGLGLGGINTNTIAQEAFLRGIDTVINYKNICLKNDIKEIKAFGTSALRGAENAKQFIDEIHAKTGIQIEVIDGLREAEFIFKGVQTAHQFTSPSFIMDIGGGSTEFIYVKDNEAVDKKSFDIGVSRILQKFELKDPLSEENKAEIIRFFSMKSQDYFKKNKAEILVGASGSFETFYELIHHKIYEDESQSVKLPFMELFNILDELIASTHSLRHKNPHILEMRENMIHIAALKTKWVIQQSGVREVWLSPASLKEGMLTLFH